MDFKSTSIYDRDMKKLDANERKLLRALLEKIALEPEKGKPMEHHANVFSKRTLHRRLVWQVKKNEGKILLLLYQDRDEAYETLRQMNLQ